MWFFFYKDPIDLLEIQCNLGILCSELNKNGRKFQKAEQHESERSNKVNLLLILLRTQ